MNNFEKNIIIAIDGFSSCGKSTLAKEIAQKINYTYIDSGAMYRAITLLAIRHNLIDGINVNEEELNKILDSVQIQFKLNKETHQQDIFINDENVSEDIRDIEVSDQVSIISKLKFVRQKLVELQRKLSKNKRIVMDGRDIGTVVFPDAELKIFMTASEDIRAKRRYDELVEKGIEVNLQDIRKNIKKRDFLDQNREESPLRKADDAIELNNSDLSKEEQLIWIENVLDEKFKK